jgi:hypothetical protein
MADTVANTTLYNGPKRMVVNSVFTIDGTEATVILVDKSAFTGPDLTEPTKLVIEKIEWAFDGMKALLAFDHTTDDEIAELAGVGEIDFTNDGQFQGFVDPASSGQTGDIIATTQTTDAGDTGSITLYLRKKD